MPKSSMAIRTPSADSRRRDGSGVPSIDITALSVSSSWSSSAGRPVSFSTRATSSTMDSSRAWRAARFTLSTSRASGKSRFQAAACRHASVSTQRPSSTISPVSSASPTKLSGISRPSRGCCQRTSASTPISPASASRTIGWYSTTNSPWASAAGIAEARAYRACSRSCRSGSNSAHLARPSDLAQYSVMSAAFIRSATVLVAAASASTPMLAETDRVCPARCTGSRSAASTAWPTSATSAVVAGGSSRITNSSPPIRATRWPHRATHCANRCPTSTSNWSPTAWPRLSLTILNPSRSR